MKPTVSESFLRALAHKAVVRAVSSVPPWCKERPHAHEPYYTFLHALVAELRPKVVVELGVDSGTSGCFLATGCSASRVISVETETVAVDNLRRLAREHRLDNLTVLHGSSTDRETIATIAAQGRIDLLLIDTLHTFAQASSEYRLYKPLMAAGSVILHDDLTYDGMAEYWATVSEPKLELPELHHSGFGASWRPSPHGFAQRSRGPWPSLTYRGVEASQLLSVIGSLDELADAAESRPFEAILEIGTHHGGFTRLLRDHPISDRCERITSFDIERKFEGGIEGVDLVIADVFTDPHAVLSRIPAHKRTAIFCDGGDKIREINTFAQALRHGDVIACHDYAKERSKFDPATYQWPSCEIEYADIESALERDNFEPFVEKAMAQSMWGCFIRR